MGRGNSGLILTFLQKTSIGANLRVSVSFSDFTLSIVPLGFKGLTIEVHSCHRFDSRKSDFITRRTPVKLRYRTVPLSTVLVLYWYTCTGTVLYRKCTVPYRTIEYMENV